MRTVLSLANPAQGQSYSPTMTMISDGNDSDYNGVIAAVQHRMSNSFSFLANYTWSHCISVGDAPGDIALPVFENSNNPHMDRANCGFDVRHIFNTSIVASSHFSSLHGIAGALVNNWQIAPIVRINSGTPLNVTTGTDKSLTGQNNDRPNLVNSAVVYTRKQIYKNAPGNLSYLNSAAFATNATGTYGNLGRNAFRQPPSYNVDAALSRIFPLRENLAFQLRLEAFNAINHPNFDKFTTTLRSGSTFGNATGAHDPRIFQLAGKITF